MRFSNVRKLVFILPFLLMGCGDGWEVVRTTDVFPYGNQRTAGSGVMYVRAKMMPKKDLKLASELEKELYAPKTHYKPATNDDPVSVGKIGDAEYITSENVESDADTSHLKDTIGEGSHIAGNPKVIESNIDNIDVIDKLEQETDIASSPFAGEKYIVVPKRDTYEPLSEGRKSLNEIYNNDPYVSSP